MLCLFTLGQTYAQVFGQNKPRYKKFDFEIYQSPNFEFYHYFDDKEAMERFAQMAENWYAVETSLLKRDILYKNPVVLFRSHGDFQQTNTVGGTIGTTTGGVTEGLKNRISIPLTISNQKTYQVFGHELVHAFQFSMANSLPGVTIENLMSLPLFMIEGLAEYISRGPVDPYTSMWMRTAAMADDVPDLKDLADPFKYFPYRYGQAFWAYMVGQYGPEVIPRLMRLSMIHGYERGIELATDDSFIDVSDAWQQAVRVHYVNGRIDGVAKKGKSLLTDENAGQLNLSPSISPNGKYVIYLSEKGIFTTELFLADARTGKTIRKISSTLQESNIDNLDAFESAGTWSPKSDQFAHTAFSKGKNRLIIRSVDNPSKSKTYTIKGVDYINSPTWSPDGKTIVFSALKDGKPDLYAWDIKSEKLTQLTNNFASELMPKWSPDGKFIVFSTDERDYEKHPQSGPFSYDLALLDMNSKVVELLPIFLDATNLNPNFDKSGNIWFTSNRNGYQDLYKYEPQSDSLFQMTSLNTGIGGISEFAPALSVAYKSDKILYNLFEQGKYSIYAAKAAAFDPQLVDPDQLLYEAAYLPGTIDAPDIVAETKANNQGLVMDAASMEEVVYKPVLRLDHISASGGLGVGNNFGGYGNNVGLAGGLQLVFSDMLGDHVLSALVSMNGSFEDFGAIVQYLNKKHHIHWGVSLGHIPQTTGTVQWTNSGSILTQTTNLIRIFQDQLSLLAYLPINRVTRIESNLSTSFQYFSYRIYEDLYENIGGYPGNYLGGESQKVDVGDDLYIDNYRFSKGLSYSAGLAMVGDNSVFGMASPLKGFRYRIGGNWSTGIYKVYNLNFDFRKYFYAKPVSFAFMMMHNGTYGQDYLDFYPSYIGTQGLVRGLTGFSQRSDDIYQYGFTFDQLLGSKLLYGSFEIRLPFTGPEKLTLIPSNFLFSELNAFFDVGTAFDEWNNIKYTSTFDDSFNEWTSNPSVGLLQMTTGVSCRVVLFGSMVIEPYYAWQIRENGKGVFGMNFLLPGW